MSQHGLFWAQANYRDFWRLVSLLFLNPIFIHRETPPPSLEELTISETNRIRRSLTLPPNYSVREEVAGEHSMRPD